MKAKQNPLGCFALTTKPVSRPALWSLGGSADIYQLGGGWVFEHHFAAN